MAAVTVSCLTPVLQGVLGDPIILSATATLLFVAAAAAAFVPARRILRLDDINTLRAE